MSMTLCAADFSLAQIHASGQCFLWQPLGGGAYHIPAMGHTLTAEQHGDSLALSCTEAEWERVWRDYFDWDTDYAAIKARVPKRDTYLTAAVQYGAGLRILRQDLWEIIVSFLVSQNNNIPRIRKNLQALCESAGGVFPSAAFLAAQPESALRALGLGYRAAYLRAAGEYFSENAHLQALRNLPYKQAHERLCARKGIGPKVADCICLFGLHHLDAFPLDTHIKQILQTHYPSGFPYARYAHCAGVIQQYMFYYDLKEGAQA